MWVRERLGAELVSERRACQVLGQVLGKLLGPANRRRAVMWVRERLGAESLRTSGLPSAGTGSIDPAKGKANSR